MKAPLVLTLCLMIAHLLVKVACNDGGINIHGGYYEVFNEAASRKLDTVCRWGASTSGSQSNRKLISGTSGWCWKDEKGYCHLKFVVSRTNTPNEEHYQIMGSKLIIMDKLSRYVVQQDYGWGVQEAFAEVEDHTIAHGHIWSSHQNAWGYGYLHLFVKKTTRPSISVAFLFEARNAGSESHVASSELVGQKGPLSVPVKLSGFQCWTQAWDRMSVGWWTMYRAQTKLVDYTPIYEEKIVTPINTIILKSLTLENLGTGVMSNDFAKLGSSETITLATTTKISSTFDFAIDIGSSVSMNVGFVSASLDVKLHFGYSTTSSQQDTKTTAKKSTIVWPSKCPTGTKIEIVIFKVAEKQSVPIEFTFERNGERFTERKILTATVNTLKQQLTNCCLNDSATDQCNSAHTPICSK